MKNIRFYTFLILINSVLLTSACSANIFVNLKDHEKNVKIEEEGDLENNNIITQTEINEGVIAKVNGIPLTTKDYNAKLQSCKSMYGEEYVDELQQQASRDNYIDKTILDNMISDLILLEAAEKSEIQISSDGLQENFKSYKTRFSSDEEYRSFLEFNGMTETYLIEELRKDYIINQYFNIIMDTFDPTDDELNELFLKNNIGQLVEASHILVNTEDEAKMVLDELNNGVRFEELAKKYSIDGNKDKGGELGYFSYSDMIKEFSEAAFLMNVGDISGPVQTEFGFHIIKVTDRKTDATVSSESSKDSLIENYKNDKYKEYIRNLKNEAVIVEK